HQRLIGRRELREDICGADAERDNAGRRKVGCSAECVEAVENERHATDAPKKAAGRSRQRDGHGGILPQSCRLPMAPKANEDVISIRKARPLKLGRLLAKVGSPVRLYIGGRLFESQSSYVIEISQTPSGYRSYADDPAVTVRMRAETGEMRLRI